MQPVKPQPFQDNLKVGDQLIYSEDDWIARCQVAENTSDEQWLRFKLVVQENIQQTQIFTPVEVGTVFDVSRRRDYGGCWTMEPVPQPKLKGVPSEQPSVTQGQ